MEDGVAERLIEEAFTEMAAELPRQQLLYRRTALMARARHLAQQQTQLFAHPPVRVGTANPRERAMSAAHVPSSFEDQVPFLRRVHQSDWLDLPQELALPLWRVYLVVEDVQEMFMNGSISGPSAVDSTFWCCHWTQLTPLNLGIYTIILRHDRTFSSSISEVVSLQP